MEVPRRIEILLESPPANEGWWTVTSPTVPGAITQGETIEEACVNMGEALTLMLEDD